MEANKRQFRYDHRTSYIEGNTVRKQNEAARRFTRNELQAVPDRQREEQPYELPSRRRQQQRQPKAMLGISFPSLLVLTAAIIATLYICTEYLKLQTEVSRMDKSIISMEQNLTALTNKNDAAYEAINTAYDLDYVYHVAVEELGMVYPNDNQVITYQSSGKDYVRQYEDIPD